MSALHKRGDRHRNGLCVPCVDESVVLLLLADVAIVIVVVEEVSEDEALLPARRPRFVPRPPRCSFVLEFLIRNGVEPSLLI